MKSPTPVGGNRLAAFIDGEGSIRIATHSSKKGNICLYLDMTVTNCDPRLINWLKTTFGGNTGARQHKNERWAPGFYWNVACKVAENLLRECLPYFVMKREQAEIALAFAATLTRSVGVKGHTEETWRHRMALRDTLREMHGGGKGRQNNRVIAAIEQGRLNTLTAKKPRKGESPTVQ